MPFPELVRAIKDRFADRGEPLRLFNGEAMHSNVKHERKYAGGVGFDAISAGWYLRNDYPQIYSILTGGMPAWSGEAVSLETALGHSVVFACNRVISESIGFIPAYMMQRTDAGKRKATEHPMYSCMVNAPNDEITAQAFTETLTSHCVMTGNGYAKITRRSGTGVAIGLNMLLPQQVYPDREKTGQKRLVYVVKNPGSSDTTYTVVSGKPQDILHLRGLGWDGVRGYSVITMGRQSMGTAIAQERNLARFWAMGGRVPYHLEMASKFKTEQDFQKFREDWEKTYAEPWRGPILENGTTLKQDGSTMRDAQSLELRQWTVSEICRWFSMNPHLVQDLSQANYSTIEQLFLEFVTMNLSQWMSRWEGDYWRCVLTPDEKSAGYFLRHNARALLRGDFKSRMDAYATALQNGLWNIDECRDDDDKDPLPNGAGKPYHFQMNMQTLPGTGQPTTVEQGILARSAAAKKPQDDQQPAPSDSEKRRRTLAEIRAEVMAALD